MTHTPPETAPPLSPRATTAVVAGLLVAQFAFLALPRVRATPGLWGAVLGWGLLALLGVLALHRRDRRAGRRLEVEPRVRTPHWVQLLMHSAVFAYWGWHWEQVAAQVPLMLAQVAFAYLCELLTSWRRYGRFRLGFGPWPVVGSTNLFLWWHDPYFAAQFGMIALTYASRELFRWRRGGQIVHVFNPSAFGLALAALVMIVFEVAHLTWGHRISLTLGQPEYCYEWIFAVGLVVMVLFRVTLTTMGAALSMLAIGQLYEGVVGVSIFLDTAITIAVFLGMNLLITDPVTSPRSGGGKLIFGALYGVLVCGFYLLLGEISHPPSGGDPGLHVTFLDKLLPVPILNLLARPIDRLMAKLPSIPWPLRGAAANGVHVGLWIGLFLLVRPALNAHPGRSLGYWEQACREHRPRSCATLVAFYERACESGIGEACHNLGVVFVDGLDQMPRDAGRAVGGFDRGCALGFAPSCGEIGAALLLGTGVPQDAALAEAAFERGCAGGDGPSCDGLGELLLADDPAAARGPLGLACIRGVGRACFAHGELLRLGRGGPRDPAAAAEVYRVGCRAGSADACNAGALMRWIGDGIPPDRPGALELLRVGCDQGSDALCRRLRSLEAGDAP